MHSKDESHAWIKVCLFVCLTRPLKPSHTRTCSVPTKDSIARPGPTSQRRANKTTNGVTRNSLKETSPHRSRAERIRVCNIPEMTWGVFMVPILPNLARFSSFFLYRSVSMVWYFYHWFVLNFLLWLPKQKISYMRTESLSALFIMVCPAPRKSLARRTAFINTCWVNLVSIYKS